MKRSKGSRNRWRWLAALLLLVILAGGFGWWHLRHWHPETATYPDQGVEIGEADGGVEWTAIKAVGASFAYIDASAGAFARDPRFTTNYEDARAAKLKVGAVHRYDPCQPADKQAANFVTVVPRDAALLPPVVWLDRTADDCLVKVSDAAMESELMTFLNQVETHTGKAAMLKLSRTFEKRYHIASALDRNLWLEQDRLEPDYAGRPWALWTANHTFASDAGASPLRWVVVQP